MCKAPANTTTLSSLKPLSAGLRASIFGAFSAPDDERAAGGESLPGRTAGRPGTPASTRRARSSPRHARGPSVSIFPHPCGASEAGHAAGFGGAETAGKSLRKPALRGHKWCSRRWCLGLCFQVRYLREVISVRCYGWSACNPHGYWGWAITSEGKWR